LESVYEAALCRELWLRGLDVRRQVALPVFYKGVRLGASIRPDLLMAESVVVEVKSVEKILPVHRAQLLTYLRLTNLRVGLLIIIST
jgi:GxxExxY protein